MACDSHITDAFSLFACQEKTDVITSSLLLLGPLGLVIYCLLRIKNNLAGIWCKELFGLLPFREQYLSVGITVLVNNWHLFKKTSFKNISVFKNKLELQDSSEAAALIMIYLFMVPGLHSFLSCKF